MACHESTSNMPRPSVQAKQLFSLFLQINGSSSLNEKFLLSSSSSHIIISSQTIFFSRGQTSTSTQSPSENCKYERGVQVKASTSHESCLCLLASMLCQIYPYCTFIFIFRMTYRKKALRRSWHGRNWARSCINKLVKRYREVICFQYLFCSHGETASHPGDSA